MALAENQSRQPYLDNFDLPASRLKLTGFEIPSLDEIDVDSVEFIIDVDLDELAVYLRDRSRPFFIDEVDNYYSIAIDEDSDEVVGIILNRFLSKTLPTFPELVPILRHATVIAGVSVQSPAGTSDNNSSNSPGIRNRLRDWVSDRIREEERRDAFSSFADLVGIH